MPKRPQVRVLGGLVALGRVLQDVRGRREAEDPGVQGTAIYNPASSMSSIYTRSSVSITVVEEINRN